MSNYIPIRNHSHYSLLASTSRCEQIVKKCKEYGYTHAGLTDISTVSGVVTFLKSCKEEKITPIIGSEIILKDGSHLTLICKNKSAWTELLRVISLSNNDSNFDEVPRISFEELVSTITPANFIVIDGYIGSFLFNEIFPNKDCIFNASDEEAVRGCAQDIISAHIEKMSIFPDYYLEVDRNSPESLPVLSVLCEMITECDPTHKYTIPSTCSFYPDRRDAVDHRVLLCVKLKTTLKKLNDKIESLKDIEALKFIRSGSFHIKGPMDHIEQELQNLQSIASKCESFDIFSPPRLPKFKTPNGESEIEYLKELCRVGWKRLISTKVEKEKHEEYKNRVLMELDVIEKANLAGYFLIVQDYVNEFRQKGVLVGHGRGCFLPNTHVFTDYHSSKPIRDIRVGERVIDHEGIPRLVLQKFEYEVSEDIVRLEFSDGSIVDCTPDHLFLTKNDGWIEAKDLRRSDKFVDTIGNRRRTLTSKRTWNYQGAVYDLEVEWSHTYNVEGIAVHNSAAGCLISYLLGITLIDPIPYGLLFSRFYSAGRNIAGSISLPDIDVDFPPCYREDVISYIRNRYGNDKVCQMITYGRLAGKSIIKEVLRVNESCSPSEMNKITEKIPNEAAISDLLEEMDEPSVIMWALEHDRDSLIDYCWLENGELRGDYAKVFEQAIRMEGIFKNQGKHAAGVIVCADSLDTICPMVRDKHGHLLAGMEMGDLEALGCPKVDILGVSALEKLANTVRDVSLEEQND